MKYITNMFGQCPLEDAVNMIDIHLQYIDFVPEDTPDYQRFPLQKEGFLKKLNKTERSELKDVIGRLRGLQKDLAKWFWNQIRRNYELFKSNTRSWC